MGNEPIGDSEAIPVAIAPAESVKASETFGVRIQ
jgi:hypothetical protein